MSKTYTYEHKGYCICQTSYNWHYFIVDTRTNKWVCHCSCTKKLTEQEAKAHIENFIKLKRGAL